ncbi:MAG: hypothetical protein LBF86_04100 [Helicobacteraceae bacterium]|jgi:uncharacterized membrane protein YuzA (DUF378 family)|nr:hypothetical protein [Helicobacteraceae bacterium]
MKEAKSGNADNRRTLFLGIILGILAVGFIAETAGAVKNGVEYALYAIVALAAFYAYSRYKELLEKRRLEENARKAEERRRVEEERKKLREQRLLEELGRKKGEDGDDKDENEPKAEEIKGEHYAKIVAAAFKRLGYDVTYRDVDINEDDAVHLIATRANEICLIHCSNNMGEVTASEVELFAMDCAAFFKRHNFWQDDVRYVYVLMSLISQKALDYIEKERKKNVPIEYRVITQ